jgi:hypothetical protein
MWNNLPVVDNINDIIRVDVIVSLDRTKETVRGAQKSPTGVVVGVHVFLNPLDVFGIVVDLVWKSL